MAAGREAETRVLKLGANGGAGPPAVRPLGRTLARVGLSERPSLHALWVPGPEMRPYAETSPYALYLVFCTSAIPS